MPISGSSPQGFLLYPTHAGRTLSASKHVVRSLTTCAFLCGLQGSYNPSKSNISAVSFPSLVSSPPRVYPWLSTRKKAKSKKECYAWALKSLIQPAQAPGCSQGWSLDLYTGPGTCIGTGTVPANMDMSALVHVLSTDFDSGTGMITPHSQLRQFSLMPPVDLSLDSRPLDANQAPAAVTTTAAAGIQSASKTHHFDRRTQEGERGRPFKTGVCGGKTLTTHQALSERLALPT